MFKLIREFPQRMEIQATPQQIVSMFPIEVQEHPHMGEIERVWKTDEEIFSVNTIPEEFILDLTKKRKHLQVSNEKMLEILQSIESFKIILYYEGNEDIYIVEKIEK
jgi:hypothetical protein